jgi:hypothetical protein
MPTFHFIEHAPTRSWTQLAAAPSLKKRNCISGSHYSISNGKKNIASSAPPRLRLHRLALPSTTPIRKAKSPAAMSPPRLLAASTLVGLFASAATLLTAGGGLGGFANLLWAVGVPVVTARIIDPRKDAWVTTSVWLVMCSFAVIVATAR